AVLGVAVERTADAFTQTAARRAAAGSLDAGRAAAARVVAAAAMVRIGRDQDAGVAAAGLSGRRTAAGAVPAGLVGAALLSATSAIAGIGADVRAGRAAHLQSGCAGGRAVGLAAVAVAAGASDHRGVTGFAGLAEVELG